MRMQGCRQCDQITSGDCGQHGPIRPPFVTGYPDRDPRDVEIARLLARLAEAQCDIKDQINENFTLQQRLEEAQQPTESQKILAEEFLKRGAKIDALQRRVEALKEAAQQAKQALGEYIRVVQSVNRPESFATEVSDAGRPAREAIKQLEAALRGGGMG